MTEFVFPVAAILLTLFVVIPAFTLVSAALLKLRRSRERIWARFGSELTFALLAGPTLIPVFWLFSSAAHQSEPSRALKSCIVDHVQGSNCADALFLVGAVAAALLVAACFRAQAERPRLNLRRLPERHLLQARLAGILCGNPRLEHLRIHAVTGSAEPVFTTGWLQTEIFVDACFAEAADDKMLEAALLHESAHMSSYDNLRCFVVRLALSVNPLGSLLKSDFRRWRQAREADCDSAAVHAGGEALALAQSILCAAKFRCGGPLHCGVLALCGSDVSALKLRVALLLDGPPRPKKTLGHVLLGAALLLALMGPHFEQLAYLDAFHLAVEQLIHPNF